MIRYEGTVRGFRMFALRELRKAAMKGWSLADPEQMRKLQKKLNRARIEDLKMQILAGPKEAA